MWKSLNHKVDLLCEHAGERFARFRGSIARGAPLRDWKLWVLLTVLPLAGYLLCTRVAVALSPSLPHRVFILERSGRTPGPGDYVLFTFSSPLYDNGRRIRVIKAVSCVGGERLEVDRGSRACRCNGRFVAQAKVKSLAGKPLPLFSHDGPVPEGSLFVTGSHRDSFDSRYWGFVEEKTIEAIAIPLF
jgi:conjugal transfer pilin signal peptidase TrbI